MKTTRPQPRRPRASTPRIPNEAIAKRAYEIFLARGGGEGNAIEDWLQAERELIAHRGKSARAESAVDRALAQSFPASDPPPWTPANATVSARPASRRGRGGTSKTRQKG